MAKENFGTIALIGVGGYLAGGFFGFWPLPSFLSGLTTSTAAVPVPVAGITPATAPIVTQQSGGIVPAPPVCSPGGVVVNGSCMYATPATVAVAPPPPPVVITSGSLAAQLQSKAGASNLTFDQWNYYYNALYGSYLQAPAGTNTTTTAITAPAFFAAAGVANATTKTATSTGSQRRGIAGYQLIPNYVPRRRRYA